MSIEQQREKTPSYGAESKEAGFEGKESKESKEEKEMATKEKIEQKAVEVKNTKQRMQNIMVNMQQVIAAVRAIRQQLGLDENGEVPAVQKDQRTLDELKKKLAGLLGQIEDLKLALAQEEIVQLRQINPNLSQEQLETEAQKRVAVILLELGIEG